MKTKNKKFKFSFNGFIRTYSIAVCYACAVCLTFIYGLLFSKYLFKNNPFAGVFAIVCLLATALILYVVGISIANYDSDTYDDDDDCTQTKYIGIPYSYIESEIARLLKEADTFNESKRKEKAKKNELLAKAEAYKSLMQTFKEKYS